MSSGACIRRRRRRRVARLSLPSSASSEGEEPLSPSGSSPLSPSEEEEEEEEERAAGSRSRQGHRKAEDSEIAGGKKESPLKDNLSPWEEWFIGKEKELRARLQARAAEEMNKQLEKMKQKQECERRKRIAEEKHKEWVQKKREETAENALLERKQYFRGCYLCDLHKSVSFSIAQYCTDEGSKGWLSIHETSSFILCIQHRETLLEKSSYREYEERRKRERKLSKEMAEKATRELEKMQLQEKAEVKYKEWLKKKRAEEAEKKKKEKEKEKEREAELQEKKARSEKIFKEWLHNARNKPRPVLDGYGFPRGKSAGCAGGNSYPAPAYCNPIPWKPIHVPPPKEDNVLTVKKSKRPVSCQSHASLPMAKAVIELFVKSMLHGTIFPSLLVKLNSFQN
ncbi:coiled-coil domain-containing protein 34 isoform 1-T2 [Alca torda]